MSLLRTVLALCATFLLSGCLQVDSLVSVKPDGSGTITLNVVMSREAVEQVRAISSGFSGLGDSNAKPRTFQLLDEAKLKLAATKMGEGVTLTSSKKVMMPDGGEGYIAVYSFPDINKVRINQNPSDAMPNVGGGGKKQKTENVKFKFVPGPPAILVINTPAEDPEKASKDKDKDKDDGKKEKENKRDKKDEFAGQILSQVLKDMKVTLAVEVEGKIVNTDADYITGNRVTMLDLDFNQLIADPAKAAELQKANPKSIEDVKKLMKGVPGVKVESKPSVRISFQ